jgi:hypothetical protein
MWSIVRNPSVTLSAEGDKSSCSGRQFLEPPVFSALLRAAPNRMRALTKIANVSFAVLFESRRDSASRRTVDLEV